jgi:hypothetical protein
VGQGPVPGAEPLTVDEAKGEIERATDDDQRLVWWQRAAALSPSDKEIMTGLAGAYRAVGQIADAERVEAVRDEELNRFDAMFPSDRAEVDAITKELPTVSSAEQLVALWNRARAVTLSMGEPLGAAFDGTSFAGGNPEMMLSERVPWATLQMYAEGTVPGLELTAEPWTTAARRTPEPEDDAFFGLVMLAYGTVSADGWKEWENRNWDYGGCSTFGDGRDLHLRVLEQTDALGSWAPVAEPVATIRASALRDLTKTDPGEFPFCQGSAETPTPTEGLLAEAGKILERVKLGDEERAQVQARVDARFDRG